MAETKKSRKPRIRKTAPTLRQKAEAEQAKSEKPKTQRWARLKKNLKRPFSAVNAKRPRVKLPSNKFTRLLAKIARPIKKVLSWLVPRYFINAWREVKLVTWPSRKETWRLTLAVFIFSVVFGALAFAVDKGLDEIFKKFVLK